MGELSIKLSQPEPSLLEIPRWYGASAELKGQQVVIGGTVHKDGVKDSETPIDTVEIYNPVTHKSRVVGTLPTAARRNEAVLSRGQLYFFGGSESREVESIDLKGVHAAGTVNETRSGSAHLALKDGKILIVGGYRFGGSEELKSAEIFDPRTGASTNIADMNYKRVGHTMTALGHGKYLIIGGKGEAGTIPEIYDSATGVFTKLEDSPLNFARKDHRVIVDSHHRIWVVGGTDADGNSVSTLEYFDPKSQKFIVATGRDGSPLKLSVAREDIEATYVEDKALSRHFIVVTGGEVKQKGQPGKPSDAFDVIDIDNLKVASTKLPFAIDEPDVFISRQDRLSHEVELTLLQGVGLGANPTQSLRMTIEY